VPEAPDEAAEPLDDERTISGEHPLGPALVEQLGGKRGLVDSGLPAVVFVGVNSLVDVFATRSVALRSAIISAVVCGLVIIAIRLVRKEPVRQAASGFLGLAIAVFFAARTGRARDFFIPGIVINVTYCGVFLLSAMIGRPIVGAIYGAMDGLGDTWRTVARLRRVFTIATIGWAAIFATRALVQVLFYNADRPGLLAVSKLLLGWPVTIGAVAITVSYVRRSHHRAAELGLP
jgi:hypothetical protein